MTSPSRYTQLLSWESSHITHSQDTTPSIQENVYISAFQTTPTFSVAPSSPESPGSSYHTFSQDDQLSSTFCQKSSPRTPRPPNCFILFRADFSKLNAKANSNGETVPDKTLSKRAAEEWKKLSLVQKQKYIRMAEEVRKEHTEKYPNYQFKPNRRNFKTLKKYPRRCPIPRRTQANSAGSAGSSVINPIIPSPSQFQFSSHLYRLSKSDCVCSATYQPKAQTSQEGTLRYTSQNGSEDGSQNGSEDRSPSSSSFSYMSSTPELSSSSPSPRAFPRDSMTVSPQSSVAALSHCVHPPSQHLTESSLNFFDTRMSQPLWERSNSISMAQPHYPSINQIDEYPNQFLRDTSFPPSPTYLALPYGHAFTDLSQQWAPWENQGQHQHQFQEDAMKVNEHASHSFGGWCGVEDQLPLPDFAATEYLQLA